MLYIKGVIHINVLNVLAHSGKWAAVGDPKLTERSETVEFNENRRR